MLEMEEDEKDRRALQCEQVCGAMRLVIGDGPPIVAFWPDEAGGINRVQDGFEPNNRKSFVIVYMSKESDETKGSIYWDGLPKEYIIKALKTAVKTLEVDQTPDNGITNFEWVNF